ncbi:MFS transporter [Pseudonocardia adelaidensis]|uniref:MFS transporter n=1 Tax=Pseudonocardia adelaidensis TaxID=648754 RepID=A0ABP9NND0_9PSEU
MSSTESTRATIERPRSVRDVLRAVAGASVGNAVEWFDYSMYGYLSASIAVVFFPSENPTTAMLATFAAFAVSFVIRPVGGLFFGSMGDRIGRRNTLAIVVLLISGSTFAVGLLPGYAVIGVAAPILLITLRLLQGFSAGGEVAGSTAFLAEYAPVARRGFVVSFQNISAFLGALAGSSLVTALVAGLGTEVLNSWAWRIPFLVAGPLGLAALYLRLKLEDTPAFRDLQETGEVSSAPLRESVRGNVPNIARTFALAVMHNMPFYIILTYLPTYLVGRDDLPGGGPYLAASVALVTAVLVLPAAGALSDRIGRRPVAAGAAIGYLLLAYPIFMLMSGGNLLGVLVGQVILGLLFGVYGSAPFSMMVELFPTRTRYSAVAIGYNLAAAAFGGTAPLVCALIVDWTGDDRSPAFYLMAATVLAIVAIFTAPETARTRLR